MNCDYRLERTDYTMASEDAIASGFDRDYAAEREEHIAIHGHDHESDGDCTVDPGTYLCVGCGAYHGEPCHDCGGCAYHSEDCCGAPW